MITCFVLVDEKDVFGWQAQCPCGHHAEGHSSYEEAFNAIDQDRADHAATCPFAETDMLLAQLTHVDQCWTELPMVAIEVAGLDLKGGCADPEEVLSTLWRRGELLPDDTFLQFTKVVYAAINQERKLAWS